MFKFSAIFTATTLSATFDAAIARDAANGHVNREFTAALQAQYPMVAEAVATRKLNLDKPAHFIALVNVCMPDTRPTGAKPAMVQALHELATMLLATGKGTKDCTLSPLPQWADSEAIKHDKAMRAAKKEAAKQAASAYMAEHGLAAPAKATTASDADDALNVVLAALANGAYKPAQHDKLRAALERVSVAPALRAPRGKGAGADKAQNAFQAPVTAPDAALLAAQAGVTVQ